MSVYTLQIHVAKRVAHVREISLASTGRYLGRCGTEIIQLAVMAQVGGSRGASASIKNSVANRCVATRISLGLLELCRPSCDNLVTIIDGNRPKSAGMDALSGGCNS